MPRLRQRHELRVTTGLPQIFDIADLVFVAIVERLAELQRRLPAGLWIAIPLRREAQRSRRHREDGKAAVENDIGGAAIFVDVESRRQRCNPRRARSFPCRRWRRGGMQAELLDAGLDALLDPVTDFPPAHRRQTLQLPLQTHGLRLTQYFRGHAYCSAAPSPAADE